MKNIVILVAMLASFAAYSQTSTVFTVHKVDFQEYCNPIRIYLDMEYITVEEGGELHPYKILDGEYGELVFTTLGDTLSNPGSEFKWYINPEAGVIYLLDKESGEVTRLQYDTEVEQVHDPSFLQKRKTVRI